MGDAIRVTASVFRGTGREGDFSWMIEQPRYERSLFVFNDSEDRFEAFMTGIARGGGNAVIRPYQAWRPRAAGVPTGPGYDALDAHARKVIDRAIGRIRELLQTGWYDEVVYSASPDNPERLGHGIFDVGPDVLGYIPEQIRQAARGV